MDGGFAQQRAIIGVRGYPGQDRQADPASDACPGHSLLLWKRLDRVAGGLQAAGGQVAQRL